MGEMTATDRSAASILEVGWAGSALCSTRDGPESGDLHVVAPFEGGVLVAVIDGLGHGTEAAEASEAAAAVLTADPGAPILRLIERCHEEMRRTRGAVMSLCSFRSQVPVMTWAGVGNVEAELFRASRGGRGGRDVLASRGGVVGYRLPPLRSADVPISPGDLLVLVTDGVRSNYGARLALDHSPQELADAILSRHQKGTDDALVVVARYLGDAV
jgi:phosphoserine phosphatase RsbX